MLFSPNKGHSMVDVPPISRYQVNNPDGTVALIEGFAPPSPLRYSDVSLSSQIRDGIKLPEVSGSNFIAPSLEERVSTLENLVSAIDNEQLLKDSENE